MDDRELDLPNPRNLPTPFAEDGEEYVGTDGVRAEPLPLAVSTNDLQDIPITEFEKKLFMTEMETCDLYLHNIHKAFNHAITIKSIVTLVGAGIGVMKHRRAVLKDISNIPDDPNSIEYDNMGNIIRKGS